MFLLLKHPSRYLPHAHAHARCAPDGPPDPNGAGGDGRLAMPKTKERRKATEHARKSVMGHGTSRRAKNEQKQNGAKKALEIKPQQAARRSKGQGGPQLEVSKPTQYKSDSPSANLNSAPLALSQGRDYSRPLTCQCAHIFQQLICGQFILGYI